jgi:CubicO group peptidase (beta-lactamase class C family)
VSEDVSEAETKGEVMQKKIIVLLLLLSPVALAQNAAPDKYAEKLRRFEAFVTAQMEKDKIPGLTIGFYQGDYVWVKGFGYADLENKLPAKPESAYRLASLTKTFMGVAILQLVEQGKMNLDGEIQTYLPSYPKQKWPVTLRQLLVHTGGGQYGSGLDPRYVAPKDVVARIAKNPITFEPGTKFEYTTSGYNLLGAAIEEVTGLSLGEYLRRHIFAPLGLNDTRMDSVRDFIPNRVRTYERVNGEIKNTEALDVSTRFGGGGLTGTVPDLLKWARSVDDGRVLSQASTTLLYEPTTIRDGHYVGGSQYYTLGWMPYPINGQSAIWNNGAQIGTNTALLRVPNKNLAIAIACNLQEMNREQFLFYLYELLTDEPIEIRMYANSKAEQAMVTALDSAFNYGSQHFDRTNKAFTNDKAELAQAFAYLNRVTARATLDTAYAATMQAISDGRHPAGGDAFLKVGSYIAQRFREKYGTGSISRYSTTGAIAFFADYVALCQADAKHPRALRLSEELEATLARWQPDWARTWNDYTRRLQITSQTDFDAMGAELKKLFTGATIRPNFVNQLGEIQYGAEGIKAARLSVQLYPDSARANGNYGLFLLLGDSTEERRKLFRQVLGELEPALPYFKKSLALEPNGFASTAILARIASQWVLSDRLDDALMLFQFAAELHPRAAAFPTGVCEVYRRKGDKQKALEACQKALALDPNFAQAKDLLKQLGQ